jgi:hypothetical protein
MEPTTFATAAFEIFRNALLKKRCRNFDKRNFRWSSSCPSVSKAMEFAIKQSD